MDTHTGNRNMKVCILSVPLTQDVRGALANTFEDEGITIESLSDDMILHYDSDFAAAEIQRMKQRAKAIAEKYKQESVFYLICGGSAFLNVLGYKFLRQALVPRYDVPAQKIRLLVWEKATRSYVIYDENGDRVLEESNEGKQGMEEA